MALHVYRPAWNDRPVEGVLFDMDGLVLDTEKLYCRFWREAAAFFGYEMTYAQACALSGVGTQSGDAILRSFFGEDAQPDEIRQKRVELMAEFVAENGVELKSGIRQLLDYLQERGIPAAITSSSPIPRIRQYLAFHALEGQFAALCSGRDVPQGKPAPDIYLKGAQAVGVPPERCLALEDAPAGLLAAHRAGCLPMMIPDRVQPDGETEKLLYAKGDSLFDVIAVLEMRAKI